MVLLKGRMLSEVLRDVELQGHQLCFVDLKLWTIHQQCLVPVLKVCFSRYCSWFAELDPAFKLNAGNLEGAGWGSALTDWVLVRGVTVKGDKSSTLTKCPILWLGLWVQHY
jgi:hypothetical protein